RDAVADAVDRQGAAEASLVANLGHRSRSRRDDGVVPRCLHREERARRDVETDRIVYKGRYGSAYRVGDGGRRGRQAAREPARRMKVIILCGGMGTRLREYTESVPKPMVRIGGVPILVHIMQMYAAAGMNEFILCLGYLGHTIREYFLNYEAFNRD